MQEMLSTLVRMLVDAPEQARIDAVSGEGLVRYEVRVAPGDVGRVIGKQGRVIRSLRILARAVAGRSGQRVEVELVAGRDGD